MTFSRVARGSRSYRSGGYTMASVSGPERGKGGVSKGEEEDGEGVLVSEGER